MEDIEETNFRGGPHIPYLVRVPRSLIIVVFRFRVSIIFQKSVKNKGRKEEATTTALNWELSLLLDLSFFGSLLYIYTFWPYAMQNQYISPCLFVFFFVVCVFITVGLNPPKGPSTELKLQFNNSCVAHLLTSKSSKDCNTIILASNQL